MTDSVTVLHLSTFLTAFYSQIKPVKVSNFVIAAIVYQYLIGQTSWLTTPVAIDGLCDFMKLACGHTKL